MDWKSQISIISTVGKITDIYDDKDLEANTKELIDAADRFGVVNLKLEVEARYVNSTTITPIM